MLLLVGFSLVYAYVNVTIEFKEWTNTILPER